MWFVKGRKTLLVRSIDYIKSQKALNLWKVLCNNRNWTDKMAIRIFKINTLPWKTLIMIAWWEINYEGRQVIKSTHHQVASLSFPFLNRASLIRAFTIETLLSSDTRMMTWFKSLMRMDSWPLSNGEQMMTIGNLSATFKLMWSQN